MNEHDLSDKIKSAFAETVPSNELIEKLVNENKKIRTGKYSGIKIAALVAAVCMIGSAGVYAVTEIPYSDVFGDYVHVSDSNLANSLMGFVSDFKYKVSDDDYVIRILGIAGDDKNIILRAEIYRKDGTPVKEHFLHFAKDEPEHVYLYDTSNFEILFTAMSGGTELTFNDEGNIVLSYNLNAEKSLNGKTLHFKGKDFYSDRLIWNLIKEENIYLSSSSKGNVLKIVGTNEFSEKSVDEIIGLKLSWDFSFRYEQSESSSLKKTADNYSSSFVINELAYLNLHEKNGKVSTVEELPREIIGYPVSIEFSMIGGEIVFEYTDDFDYEEYIFKKYNNAEEIDYIAPVYNNESNDIYLIKEDGTRIYIRLENVRTEKTENNKYIQHAGIIYYDKNINYEKIYEDITSVSELYINGVVYKLN